MTPAPVGGCPDLRMPTTAAFETRAPTGAGTQGACMTVDIGLIGDWTGVFDAHPPAEVLVDA